MDSDYLPTIAAMVIHSRPLRFRPDEASLPSFGLGSLLSPPPQFEDE
ncbi:hypothetical protein HNR22_000046 [Micromonospora jinlongensis]|uniref:Uncharacterized protein n=1 Tax=Micromonospora jinlongensis TaxID=1287877 RepID=A0A7Z0BCT7_9ACTN|nr:hypothetical protein [Micromonospora jinlongensis]